MTKLYIAFHSFTCRQRCWRAKKGISRRDWTHEESGKTSECFEFSWLLDYDETSSAGHRVCSSWRPETMANTKEATGNIYNLLLTMFLDVIQWLVSYCNWAMVNKIETNIKHTITVKQLKNISLKSYIKLWKLKIWVKQHFEVIPSELWSHKKPVSDMHVIGGVSTCLEEIVGSNTVEASGLLLGILYDCFFFANKLFMAVKLTFIINLNFVSKLSSLNWMDGSHLLN